MSAVSSTRPERSARRSTPLRGWLTADAISLTGTRVSMIAVPWFVLTTTGSATQTGLVAFAEMTPMVLLKALGGPVIDRLGARRVAVACDVASFAVVGLIPLLHALGALGFPVLLVLVALGGALRGPGDAAKHALVPQVSAYAGVPLERVTGLGSSVERTASMLGAAFAGGLVALIGPAPALTVDAVSFGLSALVLAWSTRGMPALAGDAPGEGEGEADAGEGYWAQLRAGWHFLRHETVVLGLSLMIAVTNLLDIAYASVLLPVWARQTGSGAGTIGLVFATMSGASVAGALIAAKWGAAIPRFRMYVVAFLVAGLPRFVVLALESPLWAILAVSVVAGVFSGFLNPILGAVFFERIPAHLTGRVSSLSTSLCFALMPLGGLTGGLLVAGLGLSPALLVIGMAYLLATMAPVAVPSFRAMDRPATRTEVAEEAEPANA